MFQRADIAPDYAFYTDTYHGKMAVEDFEFSLPDALADVAYRIWEHADITPYIKPCKMAVCAVCELIGNPDKRRTSYTAGKVSETYTQSGFTLSAEAAVIRYLGSYRILKRGQWL